jgi:outer membrane receptor for ferrienterochelin and colicins
MRHVVAVGIAALLGAPLGAQEPASRGELRGSVTDAASALPIPAAEVLVIADDTIRITADDRGDWRSSALAAGRYRVLVRALGFRAAEATVEVREGNTTVHATQLTPVVLALDAIVVTAARREQKLKDVIVATEVIGRQEIERSGASDLAAVLIEQTGIELSGGHPAGSGVMIQGIGSERVLVLLDGQPIVGRISGEFDISRIPTSVVERVEIVKGPQAALYGSDAMGGVINVITRSGRGGREGLHVAGTLTAGTQARLDGSAGVEFASERLAAFLDVGRRSIESTPGRSEVIGALAERNDIAVKAQWRAAADANLEAAVLALDERQRWRSGGVYNFADNQQWSGRLSANYGNVRTVLYGSVFEHLSRGSLQPLPIAGDTGQRQVQRLFQGEVMYNGRLRQHAVDIGLQLRRDDTRSVRIPGGLRTLSTIEPLAQLELAPTDRLGISSGVRVSQSSRWGTHVTPRLAFRVGPLRALTLRGSVGTGFRAPDFRELYMFFVNESVGYSVRGNPELQPEHSINYSVGSELSNDAAFVRAQLYWNEFRDFIETRPVNGPDEAPVFLYANVDDGRTRGAELEGGFSLARVRLEGGYSLLETRDHESGQPLLGRPPHAARASGSLMLPLGLRANMAATFTSRTPMQRDSAGTITSWRDAFLRLDVRAARTVGAIDLVIGANNVFDTQPAEWAGLTRRHVYTGVSWSSGIGMP